MQQHRLVFVVSILLFVFGCTGRAYTPNYIADNPVSREQAMVVLGAEAGGNVQSYLVALYLNKELAGMQGPIKGKSKKFWTAHHHFKYTQVDSNGHVFLVWQIPQEAFARRRPNAMAYVACISNESVNFFYFDAYKDLGVFSRPPAMGLFPLVGTRNNDFKVGRPAQFNDGAPLLNFQSCTFSVEKSALYYLGDLALEATLSKVDDNADFTLHSASIQAKIHKEKERFEDFLKSNGLSDRNVIDLSKSWQVQPMSHYFEMTRKPVP